jgi:hypothetical protein
LDVSGFEKSASLGVNPCPVSISAHNAVSQRFIRVSPLDRGSAAAIAIVEVRKALKFCG